MLDEVDDSPDYASAMHARGSGNFVEARQPTSVARLVCRMYRVAPPALRARLLNCLVRPLGTLGIAGVAAGAFGVLLYRASADGARATIGDATRFSNDQMLELARFVEQVRPDAFQEFAKLFTENPMGIAAFTVSAALLLIRVVRKRNGGGLYGRQL